jgi:ribosomal protein S18 acetylase RimI-like enzyme
MNDCILRRARPEDRAAAYYVCLKTGDYGKDGEPFYNKDPDALGRIFVGPYLEFEPEFSLVLEDESGVCGYAFAALDSHRFYERYEKEWRPKLAAKFPMPSGDPSNWSRVQQVHSWYHNPDYFCPEPYAEYPSHLHIDLLTRAQNRGYGRNMMERLMAALRACGSPGAHLGVSALNFPAQAFYKKLGFQELVRTGSGNDAVIYMGRKF